MDERGIEGPARRVGIVRRVASSAALVVSMCLASGAEASEATVSGRLLDTDGTPRAGARVTFIPVEEDLVDLGLYGLFLGLRWGDVGYDPCWAAPVERLPHATSDVDGHFILAGPWTPTADAFDHPSVVVQAPGAALALVKCHGAGPAFAVGDVVLAAGVTLTGHVFDDDGALLEGATVLVHREWDEGLLVRAGLPSFLRARTDDSGRYTIRHVPPGPCHLEISAMGFERQGLDTGGVGGRRVATMPFVMLDRGRSIEGRVLDANGRAVADATVFAVQRSLETRTYTDDVAVQVLRAARADSRVPVTRTDEQGAYRLGGLADAPVMVLVDAPGHRLHRQDFAPITPDARREITLEPQRTLDVEVISAASGERVDGAQLLAYRKHGGIRWDEDVTPLAHERTGPGTFTVEHVGAWATCLAAWAPGHGRAFVELRTESAAGSTSIELPVEATVSGRVLDADGNPRVGLRVHAFRHLRVNALSHLPDMIKRGMRLESHHQLTAADGSFHLAQLEPAKWWIHCDSMETSRASKTFQIEQGSAERVEFRALDSSVLRGTVLIDGQPAEPGVRVRIRDAEGDAEIAITDGHGRFARLDLAPGPYVVTSQAVGETPVTLEPGQRHDIVLELSSAAIAEAALAHEARTRQKSEESAAREAERKERYRREKEEQYARMPTRAHFSFDEGAFPDLSIFTGSAMTALFHDPTLFDRSAEERAEFIEMMVAGMTQPGEEPPSPADLEDATMPFVPVVLQHLEPLWDSGSWGEHDVRLARAVVTLLDSTPFGLPDTTFAVGEDASNAAALRSLMARFRDVVASPRNYSRLLFTMDHGPFAGRAIPGAKRITSRKQVAFGEGLEVLLGEPMQDEGDEILQGLRDGEVLWTVELKGTQPGMVLFADPDPLGAWGWMCELTFGERVRVYLDARGSLLFYYVSW